MERLIYPASGKVVKKKILVWIKYGERGKVKGAKILYRPWGGGDFKSSGVREVGISGR